MPNRYVSALVSVSSTPKEANAYVASNEGKRTREQAPKGRKGVYTIQKSLTIGEFLHMQKLGKHELP